MTASTVTLVFSGAGSVQTWEHTSFGPVNLGSFYCYSVWVQHSGTKLLRRRGWRGRAVQREDGPVKWKYTTGATAVAPPTVGHGRGPGGIARATSCTPWCAEQPGGGWPGPDLGPDRPRATPVDQRSPIVPIGTPALGLPRRPGRAGPRDGRPERGTAPLDRPSCRRPHRPRRRRRPGRASSPPGAGPPTTCWSARGPAAATTSTPSTPSPGRSSIGGPRPSTASSTSGPSTAPCRWTTPTSSSTSRAGNGHVPGDPVVPRGGHPRRCPEAQVEERRPGGRHRQPGAARQPGVRRGHRQHRVGRRRAGRADRLLQGGGHRRQGLPLPGPQERRAVLRHQRLRLGSPGHRGVGLVDGLLDAPDLRRPHRHEAVGPPVLARDGPTSTWAPTTSREAGTAGWSRSTWHQPDPHSA